MKIINATPHKLTILDENEFSVLEIEPSNILARLDVTSEKIFEMGKEGEYLFPVYKTIYGEPSELPTEEDGVIYITSLLYAMNINRDDVYYPGQLVRNDEGEIVGCIGLTKPPKSV